MVDCFSFSLLLGSNHPLLIRFRHLCQFPFSSNQTVVIHRFQPLYSMASSIAHDFFLQEAHTICYVHLLMLRAWRHSDVTHVPLVIQVPLAICWLKKVDFDLYTVFFSGDARGLGLLFMVCACAVGLRGNVLIGMRGILGVVWRSAHVPTIPFTSLRRVNAWGLTVHARNPGSPLEIKTMWKMWI